MEVDPAAAISGLESVLTALLSGVPVDRMLLAPERTAPAGLGGFVGVSRAPRGEIGAVRVDARALIAVSARDTADVDAAAQVVVNTLLGASRSALAPVGVQRIRLVDSGAMSPVARNNFERTLSFDIVYEFQQFPDSAEGLIEEIPLDLRTLDPGAGAMVDTGFIPGALAWFEIVDDPRAGQDAPSAWSYDAEASAITHASLIRGGQNIANANKPGTYLVLRTTASRPAPRNFTLETVFRSTAAEGGIGLVFRYQNPFNFYFFLMDPAANYRLLARKLDGAFSQLETGGLDTSASFALDTEATLRLEVSGPDFAVFLDDAPILDARDAGIVVPGRVGFMARRNDGASFRSIRVVAA